MTTNNKKLIAFDLDETLIHPGCLPLAFNPMTGVSRELDSSMTMPLREYEEYDFRMFECTETLDMAKPCDFGRNFFNNASDESDLIIVTARTSFTTPNRLLLSLACKGFNLNNLARTEVFFAGDLIRDGYVDSTPQAKATILYDEVVNNNYNHLIFLDDCQANIDAIENLKQHPSFNQCYIKTYKT